MSKKLSLLVVFTLSAAFLVTGWWWIGPALHTLSTGERLPARIAAMLRVRPDGADLINAIHTRLELTLNNGQMAQVRLENFALIDVVFTPLENNPGSITERFSGEEGKALLLRLARGDLDDMQRAMRKEARLAEPDGIAGLTKTETAHGAFGLGERPARFNWDGQGRIEVPALASGLPPRAIREVQSQVKFGAHLPPTQRGKEQAHWVLRLLGLDDQLAVGDTVQPKATEYKFVYLSPDYVPAKDQANFIMFDGGIYNEYRPILAFTDATGPRAKMSDLGKIKGESSAFRIFSPAYLVVADNPYPIMVADLDSLGANKSLLSWFSSASEAVFSRWMYPAFFWSFGLFTLVFGCIAITLPVLPAPRD